MIAFEGDRRIALGPLPDVARAAKVAELRGFAGPLLAFDVHTSEPVELDLRGSIDEVVRRAALSLVSPVVPDADDVEGPARGRGRPRLGVVGREITLLPRHWDWLSSQPGGASAAIRRLVDQARVSNAGKDRRRRAQEAAYRFLTATVGDRPGFEEATRALFAGDAGRFHSLSESWPADLRDHARRLVDPVFTSAEPNDA